MRRQVVIVALFVMVVQASQPRRTVFDHPVSAFPTPAADHVATLARGPGSSSRAVFATALRRAGMDIGEIQSNLEVGPLPGDVEHVMPKSYAGFLTVNTTCGTGGAHMFFWFVPCTGCESPETAPLAMALSGGPGLSSMFMNFVENGPVWVQEDMTLAARSSPLSEFAHALYLDNPVGVGGSFADDPACYAYSEATVGEDMWSFLQEFFGVFPEHAASPFYVVTESYGGKYVSAVGASILDHNAALGPGEKEVLFKGATVGDGLIDPITQVPGYVDVARGWYVASLEQVSALEAMTERLVGLIEAEEWAAASELFEVVVDGAVNATFSDYFQIWSGCEDFYDMRQCAFNTWGMGSWMAYVNASGVRAALNMGDHVFQSGNIARRSLHTDLCKSTKPQMTQLLNDPSLTIAFYSGQDDYIVAAAGTRRMLSAWGDEWKQWQAFLGAPSKIWELEQGAGTTGFVQRTPNGQFSYTVIRNSGHICFADQNAATMAVVRSVLLGEPLSLV